MSVDKRGVKGEAVVKIPNLPISVVGQAGTDWRGKKPSWGAKIQMRF